MPSPTRRSLLSSLAALPGFCGCATFEGDEATRTTTRPRESDPTATATETRSPTESAAQSPGSETPQPPTSTVSSTPTETPVPTDTASPSTPTRTQTPSPTPTATPEPLEEDDLEFLVTVVRQPSEDAPGRIRASLTSHILTSLELSGGDPLPVGFDTLDAEQIDASTPLALFPQQSDATNYYYQDDVDEPVTIDDATYDGCWSLPGQLLVTDAGMVVTLTKRTSVVADYFPLAHHDADCPEGTYEARGEMLYATSDGQHGYVHTTMRVEVEPSGSLAVDGSMRVEPSE